MTQREANKLLKKWQKVLRLQDWKTDVRVISFAQMKEYCKEWGNPDIVCGATVMRPLEKSASVYITRFSPGDKQDPMELTLIHELLHLHFNSLAKPTCDKEQVSEEQVIDCLAWGYYLTK